MLGIPGSAAALLTAGLKATFMDTYDATYQGLQTSVLGEMMHLDLPSDKLTELYAYTESAPQPVRVPRGHTMPHKGIKSVGFSVTNYDWMMAIDYHANDVADDQIGALRPRVESGARNFALLNERVFYQIITNTVDSDLLDVIPSAPDTGALYATTVNGANRFGAVNGNLLTGNGIGTAQAVRNDFMAVRSQFGLFQDTNGVPWHPDSVFHAGFVVLYNIANERIFQEALAQNPTFQSQISGGSIAAAAVQNVVTATAGLPVKLYGSQRITDNSFYVFLVGDPRKAVFSQQRMPVQIVHRTEAVSDSARESLVLGINMRARKGFGVRLPLNTVKVSN